MRAIENEAKSFIDESFRKLRSAEGAFELLLNFRNIRSRKSINEQMMSKFSDILYQYEREVDLMDRLFREFQNTPPLHRDQPRRSGAIIWEKALFYRIKHTIVRFLQLEDLMQSERGKQTKSHYLDVGRRMRAFEERRYGEWIAHVEQVLPALLKRNLLVTGTVLSHILTPALSIT